VDSAGSGKISQEFILWTLVNGPYLPSKGPPQDLGPEPTRQRVFKRFNPLDRVLVCQRPRLDVLLRRVALHHQSNGILANKDLDPPLVIR
jgi:hypothetical protein